MIARPLLRQLMTPFPYAVDLDSPVADALALMATHRVRHLPVTVEHTLVGVVTDRDLNRAAAATTTLRVRDVYTAEAYVVDLDESLETVLSIMAERHIGSALVTRKGRLAGVFTSTDACRCFGEFLRTLFPPEGDDDAA